MERFTVAGHVICFMTSVYVLTQPSSYYCKEAVSTETPAPKCVGVYPSLIRADVAEGKALAKQLQAVEEAADCSKSQERQV